MKVRRFSVTGYRLFVAGAVMALGAVGNALGQQPTGALQECPGTKGTCVEVLLRYSEQPTSGNPKVQLLDPKTRQTIPTCQICDPKTDKSCTEKPPRCQGAQGIISHAGTLLLLQTHKSPGCYVICSSAGWCKERCF
jgi:hypothetical protein